MIKLFSFCALSLWFLLPQMKENASLSTHKARPTTDDLHRTFDNPHPMIRTSQLIDTILYPGEKHFRNVQQLTFGGDNAEAYWSFDSKYIVFQRTNSKEGLRCDQIFM